jgi:hypothetical protein
LNARWCCSCPNAKNNFYAQTDKAAQFLSRYRYRYRYRDFEFDSDFDRDTERARDFEAELATYSQRDKASRLSP